MSNPFAEVTPAFASTEDWLPAGKHVVTITEAADGTSSGGHPQIELKFENPNGIQKRKQIVTMNGLGFVAALFESADLPTPNEKDVKEVDGDDVRLEASSIKALIGKKVGIVVKDEPGFNDPEKTFAVVQGYVHPSQIKQKDSDVTSVEDVNQFATFGASNAKSDEDLPF